MKKHFVFDFDDTLTNSYDFNQQMFVDTFIPYFDKFDKKTEKYLRSLHFETRGKAMHLIFEEAVNYLKLELDPLKLTKENENLHINNYESISFFEGTRDLLEMLKSKKKMISMCTNRQYGSLDMILKKYNLRKYFTNVISCKDEGHEKPDPFCLDKLIGKYDEDRGNYVYFGDSKIDYEFAEAAGIDFIIMDQYINKKKFFKVLVEAFI